jgi:hypothetical protein
MSWNPKFVRTDWRYTGEGGLEEIRVMENDVYSPLLNDLLVLLYNL